MQHFLLRKQLLHLQVLANDVQRLVEFFGQAAFKILMVSLDKLVDFVYAVF